MKRRERDNFIAFCRTLEESQKPGRQSLRRRWVALRALFGSKVLPNITDSHTQELLGKTIKELDPEENDIKALISFAVGQGLVKPQELQSALQADNHNSPLHFLAGISGKAFGETVAPRICEYWLTRKGEPWKKRQASDFYDVDWQPKEKSLIRIEIKASSESPEFRFQQIRDPRLSVTKEYAYDCLLCLGITAESVEFWVIPSARVVQLIDNGVIIGHHGGQKAQLQSNTLWFTTTDDILEQISDYHATAENVREVALNLL